MPYCAKAIKLNDECDWSIDDALAAMGKDLFDAEAVHHLHNNSYNIDAGLNDVRSLVNTEEQLICLFCRYEKDISKVEAKLAGFAIRHRDKCRIVTVDQKGMPK